MDNNNRSSLDRKVALKLVNQYAESYKTLQAQNKILEDNIKDLKINLKINKELLSKFITKNSTHQINQNILTKLNEHINHLTHKNEEISSLNISLLTQQNLLNQQISFLKEDIDSKSQQIFILEQSLQKKDNIIATFKKKIKPSNPPFIVIDPSQAVTVINDELLTYKTIYKKVSKYLQRNCERINKYENLITDLQTENGKLRTQNKLQLYSANRERTLLAKLKDEFCNKSNNNTLNTNMTDNNTCVSSYTRKGRMKLGINNLEDKMREKLELKTAKTVTCGGQNDLDMTSKLESEEYLSDDSPFFFSDVDFDGEEEFIINRYKSGSRDSNAYDVYDVSPYGYFIQKTEAPFTELENGQCEFDSVNKVITILGSNGWNSIINDTYQLKGEKFELVK